MTLFINIDFLIHRKKGSKYSSTRLFLNSNKSQKMFFLENIQKYMITMKMITNFSIIFFIQYCVFISAKYFFFKILFKNYSVVLLNEQTIWCVFIHVYVFLLFLYYIVIHIVFYYSVFHSKNFQVRAEADR